MTWSADKNVTRSADKNVTWSAARERPHAERGSAAVLVSVFCVVLVAVTLVCVALAGLLVAQRRASAAADLAALAAAASVQAGEPGCDKARLVAAANGAGLTGCATVGDVVTVEARVDYRPLAAWRLEVTGRARAGPGP
jgi:secretion/DNA translocation related TadE-like protein